MSSFHPIRILKGDANHHSKRYQSLRNLLIIIQFIVSIAIFICALTINYQLHFIKENRLGFDSENIIALHMNRRDLRQNYLAFKNELLTHPQISDITASFHLPVEIDNSINICQSAIGANKKPDGDEDFKVMVTWVDYNFIDFYNIEISQGRNFSKHFSTDLQGAVILNETSVNAIDMHDPIGERFGNRRVVGIVKDFHFSPLYYRIRPLAVILDPDEFRYISVKLNSGDIPNAMIFIEEKWKAFFPEAPFEYTFLNDRIDAMYNSENKLSQIFNTMTIITLLISYSGLFGIVSFTIATKIKEIGIRKVLGASVLNIIHLLSKEFLVLVLTGYCIAGSIAFFAMKKWLQNFTYRINISIDIYIVSGLIVLFITLLSISFQSVKAATANPVESLRYE
jgi:putative ABC transport system permease protein